MRKEFNSQRIFLVHQYGRPIIRHFHISHNAPYLPPPPKDFAQALLLISLGTAVIPRRNEEQRFCKILGVVNKVHYGKCGSGVLFWNTSMATVTSCENALH